MSTPVRTRERPAEVVAGLLATLSIVGSAVALVRTPVRVTTFTILLALIAAAIGGRHQRLAAFALAFAGVCFVVGTLLAIVTSKPIF